MAVFRVQKTQNYTIMSNHHLRNKALSLKAKGLLSLMLSLPEDWDYTTRGLASICKEGVDSVCATVRELEAAGYIIRRRIRDKNGQMRGMEYTVLEQPQPPEQDKPSCAQPKQAKPKREKPVQANPAQLNTKEQKKEITKNVSNPIRTADEREQYRDLIRENIEYDILAKNNPADRIRLDELVELMLDTVCSKRSSIRIAGDEFPTEVVKSRFLKLEAQHRADGGIARVIPLDTLSRTEGGASSRAALSTLDGRPVRGSAAFSFFPADTAACSFGGRPRRFFGCSASDAFFSGAGAGASLPPLSAAWMSERLITLPDGAGVSSPMPGKTVCCVCLSADGGSGST